MQAYIVYTQHHTTTEDGYDILGIYLSHKSAINKRNEEIDAIKKSWDDGSKSLNVDIDANYARIEHVNGLPWAEIHIEEFEIQD